MQCIDRHTVRYYVGLKLPFLDARSVGATQSWSGLESSITDNMSLLIYPLDCTQTIYLWNRLMMALVTPSAHLCLFSPICSTISLTETHSIPQYYYIFYSNSCVPLSFPSTLPLPPIPASTAKLKAYGQNQSHIFTAHVRHFNASSI